MTRMRVWGYATEDGDMALTACKRKAAEWRRLLRERGETGPIQFVLTPSADQWMAGKREIAEMRTARRETGRG